MDVFELDQTLGRNVVFRLSIDPSEVSNVKSIQIGFPNGTIDVHSVSSRTVLIKYHILEVNFWLLFWRFLSFKVVLTKF